MPWQPLAHFSDPSEYWTAQRKQHEANQTLEVQRLLKSDFLTLSVCKPDTCLSALFGNFFSVLFDGFWCPWRYVCAGSFGMTLRILWALRRAQAFYFAQEAPKPLVRGQSNHCARHRAKPPAQWRHSPGGYTAARPFAFFSLARPAEHIQAPWNADQLQCSTCRWPPFPVSDKTPELAEE